METLTFPIFFIMMLLILIDDGPPIFFVQKRVGANNSFFNLYKFRSMKKNTPNIATHLLNNPDQYLLTIGKLIRKISLDELPNLINILKGDMVFIGPRPALHNQHDLIELRIKSGVHKLIPGVTGWAQVNGRDELSILNKVKMDTYYLENKSLILNIKILFLTLLKVIIPQSISH